MFFAERSASHNVAAFLRSHHAAGRPGRELQLCKRSAWTASLVLDCCQSSSVIITPRSRTSREFNRIHIFHHVSDRLQDTGAALHSTLRQVHVATAKVSVDEAKGGQVPLERTPSKDILSSGLQGTGRLDQHLIQLTSLEMLSMLLPGASPGRSSGLAPCDSDPEPHYSLANSQPGFQ